MSLTKIYPSDGLGALEVAPLDPDDTVDYMLDWTEWLAGDTIATSVWQLTNATESSSSNDTVTATVFVTAGAPGQVAVMRNRITTAGGRTADRTIRAQVAER